MNTIKRIGNAILRGWKFITNKVIETSGNTLAVVTGLVDLLIIKLVKLGTGVEPQRLEGPSRIARLVGVVASVVVLLAGLGLAGTYVRLIGFMVMGLGVSIVIATSTFVYIVANLLMNTITIKFISCIALLASAMALNAFGSKHFGVDDVDDEAPLDVTPVPMHS